MAIDYWYKEIELRDGRRGCVIEVFEAPDGKDEHRGYMIELSSSPYDSETITVGENDIKRIIG